MKKMFFSGLAKLHHLLGIESCMSSDGIEDQSWLVKTQFLNKKLTREESFILDSKLIPEAPGAF